MDNLQISFDIVLTLIGLYLAFFKSYFAEKGKNLATKEDIGEITQEIETIKNEIGINSQKKLTYHFDRKKAAIDFLNSISVWLDYSMRPLNNLCNNNTDKKIISDLITDLKTKGADATKNYWSIFIYFDDKILTTVVDELYNKCVELNNLTNTMLITLERKAVEYEYNVNRLKNTTHTRVIEEIKTEIENINNQIGEIISKYSTERSEIESKAISLRLKYTIFLGELLRDNMKNKGDEKTTNR